MSILTELEARSNFRKIIIPLSMADLGGSYVFGVASVESNTVDQGVATILRLLEPVKWVSEFDDVYFQALKDGKTLKAIRPATQEDRKKYRAPLWIQGEEIPMCCGKPMFFVGQLDDDHLFSERPPDAQMWWHDRASFYVFTCSQCLAVTAVGQQF